MKFLFMQKCNIKICFMIAYYIMVQTGSGAHPASYPKGTSALSSGLKRPEREADHSPLSSAEVKNGGAMPALPHMSS
jgi:hypothetical protein